MALDETAIAQLVDHISEIERLLKLVKNLLTASQKLEKKKEPEPHYTTINEPWYSENSGIEM